MRLPRSLLNLWGKAYCSVEGRSSEHYLKCPKYIMHSQMFMFLESVKHSTVCWNQNWWRRDIGTGITTAATMKATDRAFCSRKHYWAEAHSELLQEVFPFHYFSAKKQYIHGVINFYLSMEITLETDLLLWRATTTSQKGKVRLRSEICETNHAKTGKKIAVFWVAPVEGNDASFNYMTF